MKQPTRAVIIDDEADGRNIVKHLLNRFFPGIVITGLAENVAIGIDMVNDFRPDLIFLDIEMPDGNAFDLLSACDSCSGSVILITAHDRYAIRAVRASVLDYLLKPLDEQEFINAVNTAIKKKEDGRNVPGLLLEVYQHLVIRKVRIPTLHGFSLVNIDDIIRCEASGNYTILRFINGQAITACRKLGEYEEELTGYGFIRVHKKHLINIRQIIEYNKGGKGGGFVTLSGREVVEVSARRKSSLLDVLGR